MWEYRWVEVAMGESSGLDTAGIEGWEAVGATSAGVSFGKPYVGVLMKRFKSHTVDLNAAERLAAADAAALAAADAAADAIESHWSHDDLSSLVPGPRDGDPRYVVR